MRLVLVHGIGQQGRSSNEIQAEWTSALGGAREDLPFDSVVTPFYGDQIHALAEARGSSTVVAQGFGEDDEEREFVGAGLDEIARAHSVTEHQIELQQTVEQGLPHDRRFIATLRLIEAVSPFQGNLALRLLRQAFAYLKHSDVTEAVDDLVRPAIEAGPCVVVAHSLGTVVSFRLLRQQQYEVPLFVTLGSPLAVRSVQTALGRPRLVPAGVGRWFNAVDRDDMVTLGTALTIGTFADRIENYLDVQNGEDAHSAAGYLSDSVVRELILAST